MPKTVIGVMGGKEASEKTLAAARKMGFLIAKNGWVTLTGGRNEGVMDAALHGAKDVLGGLTIGVLPGADRSGASEFCDITVITGMGSARNQVNVLSCDVVVVCSGEAGTLSELALALNAGKNIVLLDFDAGTSFKKFEDKGLLIKVKTPEEAIEKIRLFLMGQ
ncbi:MAG: DNA-binding protein [Candidatus Diapherotrites archaeon]